MPHFIILVILFAANLLNGWIPCQGQLKIVQKWQFENAQLWQFMMAIYG